MSINVSARRSVGLADMGHLPLREGGTVGQDLNDGLVVEAVAVADLEVGDPARVGLRLEPPWGQLEDVCQLGQRQKLWVQHARDVAKHHRARTGPQSGVFGKSPEFLLFFLRW